MGHVVTFEGPKKVGIREYEEQPLQPDEVRLRTLYSGISAGTELTAYRGSNPYLSKRWDDERRLFLEDEVSLQHPIGGWGYEEVGERRLSERCARSASTATWPWSAQSGVTPGRSCPESRGACGL